MRPFVIHSLGDARAALSAAAAQEVTLHSAPGAGAFAGVGWFERAIAAAQAEFPHITVSAVLDCGDAPGAVLEALRWLKEPGRMKIVLRFTGDAVTAARLADMASQVGIQLVHETADVAIS